MNMIRPLPLCAALVAFLSLIFVASEIHPTQMVDSIGSEHVRLRMPAERESLGRDAIDRELACKVAPLMRAGGFIPCCDHSVPPDVPWENFRHYRKRLSELA